MLQRYIKIDVKMPCKQVSLHRGPFMSVGNLESGGGGLIYQGL